MTRIILWFGLAVMLILAFAPTAAQVHAAIPSHDAPSDLWIKAAIVATMERDGRLDHNRIVVSSLNGHVVLSGTVLTEFERAHAERLAGGVPGVQGVDNRLQVIPAQNQDAALAAEVRTAILQHPVLAVSGLSVTASNGTVRLMGIVVDPKQKQMIDHVVSFIPGVRAVDNRVIVAPAAA